MSHRMVPLAAWLRRRGEECLLEMVYRLLGAVVIATDCWKENWLMTKAVSSCGPHPRSGPRRPSGAYLGCCLLLQTRKARHPYVGHHYAGRPVYGDAVGGTHKRATATATGRAWCSCAPTFTKPRGEEMMPGKREQEKTSEASE